MDKSYSRYGRIQYIWDTNSDAALLKCYVLHVILGLNDSFVRRSFSTFFVEYKNCNENT